MGKLFSLFQIHGECVECRSIESEKSVASKIYRWIALSVCLGYIHFVLQLVALLNTTLMILSSPNLRKSLLNYKTSYLVFIFLAQSLIVGLFHQNWVGVATGLMFSAMFVVFFAAKAVLGRAMAENIMSGVIMASNFAAAVAAVEKVLFALSGNLEHRCYSVSVNPNYYGVMAVLAIFLCAYKFVTSIEKRFVFVFSAGMNFLGLMLCGSVSLWIVVVLLLGTLFLFYKKYKYLAILALMGAVFLALFATFPQIVPRFAEIAGKDGTAGSRIYIYKCTIATLDEFPLFGRGFLSYRQWRLEFPEIYSKGIRDVSYAHNLVLDSLLSHGIVGALFLGTALMTFVVVLLKTGQRLKKNNIDAYALPLVCSLLIGILPYCMIDTTYLWCQGGMVILFVFSLSGIDQRNESQISQAA